jgi:hypothetical protein
LEQNNAMERPADVDDCILAYLISPCHVFSVSSSFQSRSMSILLKVTSIQFILAWDHAKHRLSGLSRALNFSFYNDYRHSLVVDHIIIMSGFALFLLFVGGYSHNNMAR